MRTCIVCGCTDDNACVHLSTGEPCDWAKKYADGTGLCTFCAESEDDDFPETLTAVGDDEPRIILPGDPDYHL